MMIILEGKNLCERQKELNSKVNEAAQKQVDFREIKAAEEYSDVDRLFKIDLASKYRDMEYWMEQLKCGDSLYISRALKCKWVYSQEYAHIVNPDYLHSNIFPSMSIKMKIKTLKTISLYVRDENRAQMFCEYCVDNKLNLNAYKFLVFSPISYKQHFFNKINLDFFPIENYNDLIGNSFILADIYAAKGGDVTKISYLYYVSDVEYLNLIEKYNKYSCSGGYYFTTSPSLNGKVSKAILKKHKKKVLENPLPYLRKIRRTELLKFSSSDDARVYVAALLPDDVRDFWTWDFYTSNKHIIDLIKTVNLYLCMKQIYSNKYPKEEFELAKGFYQMQYYKKIMTVKERETWALMHLEKQTGVLPEDQDFRWYEFVNFPLALKEIKKKILITTNEDIRLQMLSILNKSANTQREVEELLTYYYTRHVNEKKDITGSFLFDVTQQHRVLEFDASCWSALDKLFHSFEVYLPNGKTDDFYLYQFRRYSLLYHIINKQTLPKALCTYLNEACDNIYSIRPSASEWNKEKQQLVYEYILQILIEKIKGFESLHYDVKVSNEVRQYLKTLVQLNDAFKQGDNYPEIAIKYMNLDKHNFQYIVNPKQKLETPKEIKEITPGYLFRCLKQDATLVLEKFPLIETKYKDPSRDIYETPLDRSNKIWKKMKVYFSNDIAEQYVDLCLKSLLEMPSENSDDDDIDESSVLSAHVFAIFQLADEQKKAEFMDKHAPASGKIEHNTIRRCLLDVQAAICKLHHYSRPPLPLAKTAQYLKGDYVSKCKDMFNSYRVNLSPKLRTEFIHFLLNSPVSIQKHGLRLAFQSFERSELKDLVFNAWKKTKNVSLRCNIYTSIVEKMCNRWQGQEQEMFELLIELTAHIHQDDDESVFECFNRYRLPEYVAGLHLQTAWKTISAFPDKKNNIERKKNTVETMKWRLSLLDQDFVEGLVNDHVSKRLIEEELRPEVNPDISALNEEMWNFVAKYIISIPTESKQEKSLNVLKLVVKECFNNWNESHGTEEYVFQLFFKEFAGKLESVAEYYGPEHFPRVTHVFQYLLQSFEDKFGAREMYSYYWDWNLSLLARSVINKNGTGDKEVHMQFGSELGNFVKKLKEKNLYYQSFAGKTLGKILIFIQLLIRIRDSLSESDVKVLVACGLGRHGTPETLALALHILPEDLAGAPATDAELQELIHTIRQQDNDELIALLNDKFIYTDLKVRKIML